MTMSQNRTVVSIYNSADEKFQAKAGICRWGQILWNTAEDYIKRNCSTETIEKLMNLKSTDDDCYYSDLRVENFVRALDRILTEEEAIKEYQANRKFF